MTTVRRINQSQREGDGANNNDTNEIRPYGEMAVYVGDNNKLELLMADGVRTNLRNKVLSKGTFYGGDADSGDGNGLDTIKLIPDAELRYNNNSDDRYLIIDPTQGDPIAHIHIRAGGAIDQSTADLFLGGERNNVRVSDINDRVTITTDAGEGTYTWLFDNNGDLSLPGSSNGRIADDEPGVVVYSDRGFAVQTNAANLTTYQVEFIGFIHNGFGDSAGATLTVTEVVNGAITDGMVIYGAGISEEGWTLTFGTVLAPQGSGGVGNYYLSGANYLISAQSFNNGVSESSVPSSWVFGTDGTTRFPDDTINAGTNEIYIESSNTVALAYSALEGNWESQPNQNQIAGLAASPYGVSITLGRTNDGVDGPTWSHEWLFDKDGVFTLPEGGTIGEGGGISGAIKLTPSGGANEYQALLIYPTAGAPEGDHIHLTAGGGTTELYLGSDSQYVKLLNGGDIEIRASQTQSPYNTAAWGFGADGAISTTDSLIINVPNGIPSSVSNWVGGGGWNQGFYSNVATTGGTGTGLTVDVAAGGGGYIGIGQININNPGTGYTSGDVITINNENNIPGTFTIGVSGTRSWRVGIDGALTFPDNTAQTTAWTGTYSWNNLTDKPNQFTAESFDTDQITMVGNRIATTVTNANLELDGNGVGGIVINTVAEATTASTTRAVGYLGLPPAGSSISRTLTIIDSGKHTYVTTTGVTLTIPAASSVAYPIGTTLTFIAGPSATTVTIAINTDTLRLAGGTSTGTRTLAANGMATAVKVSGTSSAGVWYINGVGLT